MRRVRAVTTAREWLDAAQARSEAATDGPWAVYQTMHAEPRVVRAGRGVMGTVAVPAHTPDDYGNADAEFIAAARTDVPAMVAALRAVLDPETVEAIFTACCHECLNRGESTEHTPRLHRHDAEAAHDVVKARIDAALGTVTP